MNVAVVVVAAVVTYLSRVMALALLPRAEGLVLRFVERLPAPLFAALAFFALFGRDLDRPPGPTLWAALAALAVAPRRSLPTALAAGLAAYGAASLVLPS